jgi:hypothetical protein
VGATLAVIALIAVVVGVALVFTRGDDGGADETGHPASSTTTSSTTGEELPTISSEDLQNGSTVPTGPGGSVPPGSAATSSVSPPATHGDGTSGPRNPLSNIPTNPSDYQSWFDDSLDQMNPQ